MSFDLYFYKHKDNKVTEEDVAEYLSSNLEFNQSDYPRQWSYENPVTGTYFLIDWNEKNAELEDIEQFDSYADYTNLNISFSINYFRPRFFGLETFPIIDNLVEALDLYVLNPQAHSDPDNPMKFEKGALLNSWILSNDKVTSGQHIEYNLEYLSLEKSNYFWWYLYNKSELENTIVEDIYVPNLYIIKSKEDNQLYIACAWTTHIPIILPKVDYVIIQKKHKKLFRTVEESGLVSYSTIIEQLGHFFADFEYDIPNLKILTQQNADKMSKDFNNLPIYMALNEFGSGVAKDSFVNIPNS